VLNIARHDTSARWRLHVIRTMNRPPPSLNLRHIVFPRQIARRRPVPAARLVQPLLSPSSTCTPITAEGEAFLAWVLSKAGLDARMYRPETLQRRLPACLRAVRVSSVAHARYILEKSPALVQAALNAILVGVTSFFRDPPVFTALRDEVLPALRRWKRAIHVWSAGCSEGAELYSMAILLEEAGLLEGSYLLGTDCRVDAIERAKRGVFDPAAVRDVAPDLLTRYFERKGSAFEVGRRLQATTRWQVANMLSRHEWGYWDIILFRNTAMYMRSEPVAALFEKMDQFLKPGGFLVLGKAERPVGAKHLSFLCPSIYRRVR
jgi:chemotaxis protein methyltransferase CheR